MSEFCCPTGSKVAALIWAIAVMPLTGAALVNAQEGGRLPSADFAADEGGPQVVRGSGSTAACWSPNTSSKPVAVPLNVSGPGFSSAKPVVNPANALLHTPSPFDCKHRRTCRPNYGQLAI